VRIPLANKDRATGMSFCETLAAGLLGMTGPMIGALLIASFSGINVEGIRSLFFISLLATIGTFFLILTQLSNQKWKNKDEGKSGLFGGLSQLFKQGHNLKRWVVIASIGWLTMGMVFPFTQVFAYEVKGANQYREKEVK